MCTYFVLQHNYLRCILNETFNLAVLLQSALFKIAFNTVEHINAPFDTTEATVCA